MVRFLHAPDVLCVVARRISTFVLVAFLRSLFPLIAGATVLRRKTNMMLEQTSKASCPEFSVEILINNPCTAKFSRA